MGHWGWRPMVFFTFISVWIVGCTNTQSTITPTPNTELVPTITLIVVTPGLSPTPASNIIPTIITPKINQTVNYTNNPTDSNIQINRPTCYESVNRTILCMGTIHNQSSQAIENTVIKLTLLDKHGQILHQQQIAIEQHIIPPDEIAPYRALFAANLLDTFGGINASLISTRTIDDYSLPAIQQESGEMQETHYLINAIIDATPETQLIRIVATLYTMQGQVVGYRVLEVTPDVEPISIQIDITPQLDNGPFYHTLHVETE